MGGWVRRIPERVLEDLWQADEVGSWAEVVEAWHQAHVHIEYETRELIQQMRLGHRPSMRVAADQLAHWRMVAQSLGRLLDQMEEERSWQERASEDRGW